jgi:mercuric ion transport protein
VPRGFSGAGIGNLTALEPYRPVFIGGARVALFLAYRRIYRPVAACERGEVCAAPQARSAYKMIFWGVAALPGAAVAFPYILPLFN